MRRVLLPVVAALMALPAPAVGAERVLVFTRTEGFRHDTIPAGVAAIRSVGYRVHATEDPRAFTDRRLRRYAAVVWLSTTGDVLDPPQQRAFRRYVRRGGGFVGVHAAADTEYGWPWYGRLLGARFESHPPVGPGVVRVRRHASTRGLPRSWERVDEWYRFRAPPRGVRVLATVGGRPIAWCHRVGRGRSWYTALGHTAPDRRFRRHLRGGIRWAIG